MADIPIRNRLLLISLILIIVACFTPGNGKIAGNYLDKVAHFALFFFLSLNICYKYISNKRFFDYILLAILLGFLTEIIQQFIPGRNLDFYDALADTIGVISAYHFYKKYALTCNKLLKQLGA